MNSGNDTKVDGVDYRNSIIFHVVRHPVLKSLYPKEMIKFLYVREEYELEVKEKK